MANRTGKGYFVKGRSGNPAGRPKNPPEFAPHTDDPDGADRRTVGNLVIEARKFSGLAVDTLVELTKDNHTDPTRFAAAAALLDRGYGRPAQSLDLHLSADAITKRLSDMSDAELAALEAVQRRLDEHPEKMRQRRETVEHPFGTIKARMGATHFLMKTLRNGGRVLENAGKHRRS
jgi:hypothetical protein